MEGADEALEGDLGLGGQAEQGLGLPRPGDLARADVVVPEAQAGGLHRHLQPPALLLQLQFGPLAGCDVDLDAVPQGPAVLLRPGRRGQAVPTDLAVRTVEGQLDVQGRAGHDGLAGRQGGALPVLGRHQPEEDGGVGHHRLGGYAIEGQAVLGDVDEAALGRIGRGLHLVDHAQRHGWRQGAKGRIARVGRRLSHETAPERPELSGGHSGLVKLAPQLRITTHPWRASEKGVSRFSCRPNLRRKAPRDVDQDSRTTESDSSLGLSPGAAGKCCARMSPHRAMAASKPSAGFLARIPSVRAAMA